MKGWVEGKNRALREVKTERVPKYSLTPNPSP